MSPIIGVGLNWRATLLALLLALLPAPALAVNFTRNVGIGTTSPSTSLTVKNTNDGHLGGGGTAGLTLYNSSGAHYTQIFEGGDNKSYFISSGGTFTFRNGSAQSFVDIADGTLNLFAQASANSNIYFYRGGTRDWRLHDSSNTQFYVFDAEDDNGVYIAQNTNSWASLSDARLKDNVAEYSVLDRLANSDYRTVSFNWKKSGLHDIGVIAQEIYSIFPEVVNVGSSETDTIDINDPTNGAWGVQYDKLGALALEAIKEMANLADSFKAKLVTWFADATNGIGDFFAQRGHFAEEICVGSTCITGTQLQTLLASANAGGSGHSPAQQGGTGDEAGVADTEPPVVAIYGNNAAYLQVGLSSGSLSANDESSFSSKLRALFATVGSWFTPVSRAIESDMTQVTKTEEIGSQGHNPAESDSLTIGSPERPAGFTMYDIRDGRPHCVYVSGGNLLPVLGTCEETDARLFGQD